MAESGQSSAAGSLGARKEAAPLSPDTTLSATSQGFHPSLEPHVLRRSLILSACASGFGATFFILIQGTIFNFFLEDLSLKDRLPYFMAIWGLGGVGNLAGSWIQDRWGFRKSLFLWTIVGSRMIWFLIALIPIFWPALYAPGPAYVWLTVLTSIFYFVHSFGNNAWLSWMADLIPVHLQGKYWSFRQVGCSITSGLAGLLAGYYLQGHRNVTAYAIIFCLAATCGVIDGSMFWWVAHRRPKIRTEKLSFFNEFRKRIKEQAFRRLCGVYLLMNVANSIMTPTTYFFMRERVGMDPYAISLVMTLSLAGFTAFSLLWGQYADKHGHRGPLVMCLLLHAGCPIFYFFAHRGDDHLPALAYVIGQIGWCGTNLFMNPMLFHFTRDKTGGRTIGIAIFTMAVNLANIVALLCTHYIYEQIGFWIGKSTHDYHVYYVVFVMCMTLRASAGLLASLLPAAEEETEPGAVLTQFATTNPIRATYSLLKYLVGHEPWEGG